MAREFKLDIFDVLAQLDAGNRALWETFSEEQQKAFASLIIMRWMSGTSDARQIIALNEFVNPYVFALGKHQQLLSKLLVASSSKKPRRYFWLSAKSKKGGSKKKVIALLKEAYEVSEKEAVTYLPNAHLDDCVALAEKLGWQKEDIAALKKELK